MNQHVSFTDGILSFARHDVLVWTKRYAEMGLRIFPVGPDKTPLIKWKKDASIDPSQIETWWEKWPDAMIGIVTGESGGILVLDVDVKNGVDGFATLKKNGWLIPDNAIRVNTPSGGSHFYFRLLPGQDVRSSTGKLGSGLDIRGVGGYIVAVPSLPNIDGPIYYFADFSHVISDGREFANLPRVPEWLIGASSQLQTPSSLLPVSAALPVEKSTAYGEAALLGECAKVALALEGQRNDTLNKAAYAAGQLIAGGELNEYEARSRLLQAASLCGLPDKEAAATIESGLRAGSKEPRTALEQHTASNQIGVGASLPEPNLHIIEASSLHGLKIPKRQFLDSAELIPMKSVTLLYGDGGTGKSLLALQMAIAVAFFESWIGLTVRHGPVLYFSAEDDRDEIHIRINEICSDAKIELVDLENLEIAMLAGEDAVLGAETNSAGIKPTPLYDALVRHLEKTNPTLLILDNLADIFGGNEIIRTHARQFMSLLRKLAIRFECAIIVLAHPSLSGMASGAGTAGNTAWNNSARSRLYFRRDKPEGKDEPELNPNRRILESMKANYGAVGRQIIVEWRQGVFVPLEDTLSGPLNSAGKIERAERVFVDLLRRISEQGRTVSPYRSSTQASSIFSRSPERQGVSKREFEMAMENLLSKNIIRIEEKGPPSRRTSVIVLNEER